MEQYEMPYWEFITFDAKDVIITSGDENDVDE